MRWRKFVEFFKEKVDLTGRKISMVKKPFQGKYETTKHQLKVKQFVQSKDKSQSE
jgi:hypothetical protein